jgi:hypothetical protein
MERLGAVCSLREDAEHDRRKTLRLGEAGAEGSGELDLASRAVTEHLAKERSPHRSHAFSAHSRVRHHSPPSRSAFVVRKLDAAA